MDLKEQLEATLLRLGTRTDIPQRPEFLSLAAEIVTGKCVVLFWVHDRKQGRYLLDYAYDPHRFLGPAKSLSAISVEKVRSSIQGEGGTINEVAALARLTLPHDSVIAVDLYPSARPAETNESRQIGHIQIISDTEVGTRELVLLSSVSHALASAVMRWRRRRELLALRKMLTDVNLLRPTEIWMQTCATVLQTITEAKMCVVFKASRDLTVRAVATAPAGRPIGELIASPKSVLRRCIQTREAIRISDFRNPEERQAITGTVEYDEALEEKIAGYLGDHVMGFLAVPVVSEGHVLSVVALFNKTEYLPQQFTETDLSIVNSVCGFLAGVLPSVEMTKTMEELSEIFSAVNFEDEKERARLFATISQTISSVAGAMLGLKNWGGRDYERVHFGGDLSLFDQDIFRPTQIIQPIPNSSPPLFKHCVEIPGQMLKTAYLALVLTDNKLSRHEQRTLRFFVTQLGQKLRAEEIVEKELRSLVETRHAIRSGLNGLGHIEEAATCFELIASHEYSASEVMLRRAYKAIKRTRMFAEKTRMLMEESRYLLTDVSQKTLRIADYSLTDVVQQVNLSLAPDAEEKGVFVDVDNRIQPSLERMQNDPLLVEIVVFNLIDNAIKYSMLGKHVSVKLYLRAEKWCMEVSNLGPLIPKRDQDAIFLPFERRVTGEWAVTTTGTGVGLAVVKKIASAHDGSIAVSSSPVSERQNYPAKTVFILTLPRKSLSQQTP